MDSKPSLFENDLVAIHKINEPAYVGMCRLELSKVPIYEFYYDYMKKNMAANSNYNSRILTAWCMKSKLKMLMTILTEIKKNV